MIVSLNSKMTHGSIRINDDNRILPAYNIIVHSGWMMMNPLLSTSLKHREEEEGIDPKLNVYGVPSFVVRVGCFGKFAEHTVKVKRNTYGKQPTSDSGVEVGHIGTWCDTKSCRHSSTLWRCY